MSVRVWPTNCDDLSSCLISNILISHQSVSCFLYWNLTRRPDPPVTNFPGSIGLKILGFKRSFFPTCKVRVVRFYQSCSSSSPPLPPPPSPPPPLPPLPCSLPPCQLFAKLFANFRTQWALLDLNCKGLSALGTAGPQPGTFPLNNHRWTSTWDRPSSVSTAGSQPGTLRAQWAPLDLNLGPSELSEHRWTSTAK